MPLSVLLLIIYIRESKLKGTQKNIRSHAKEVKRRQLGLVVDVFTLVKDSDVYQSFWSPSPLWCMWTSLSHICLGARGTQWAQ